MFSYFKGSFLFTLVCMALATAYGWMRLGTAAGTAEVVWIELVLSVLEISLSFDNAVVNATVLKDMDDVWQKRFLTWGMVIAVFGMRIAFPLVIVGLAAHLGLSIGAMFVRSLTIMLVKRGTLDEYRYLEHGAFWAIVALAAIMLLSVRYEISETFTGLIGAVLIAASLAWSVRYRRRLAVLR